MRRDQPSRLSAPPMAWRWSALRTKGLAPSPRAGYASAIIEGELYVAGGWDGTNAFGDAFALSLDSHRWRSLGLRPVQGARLDGRIFFGSAAIGEILFIHGGTEVTNLANAHSDVIALHTSTGVMRPVTTTGTAPVLMRHAIAARGAELWVVGGSTGSRWVNDVHRLDLTAWIDSGMVRPAVWHALPVDGFVPYPRAHFCLVALPPPRPYLVLSGGGDGDADFDDAYALDVHSGYWARLSNLTTTSRPPVLTQHACALVTLPARRVADAGGRALKRAGWRGESHTALMIHGGFGGDARNRSIHERMSASSVFQLGHALGTKSTSSAWSWSALRESGSPPEARMGHTMHAPNASCLMVFGGSASGRHLQDVVVGVPNRLGRAHAAEAEADEREAEEEEARRQAASRAWWSAKEGDAGVDVELDDAEAAAVAAALEEDKDEEGLVVVRTVRTADKLKRRGGKRKKGRRGGKKARAKDEL